MATIALYAVGYAIGGALAVASGGTAAAPIFAGLSAGAIGGGIGALAGSYIDSQFLLPAVFGNSTAGFTGPRLDDYQLQTASEGSPIKFVLGPEVRLAGTIIYLSDLIESKVRRSSGGGKGAGGSSGKTTQYLYSVHVAVAWCSGPINRVRKLLADAKVIYSDMADPFAAAPGAGITADYANLRFNASGTVDFTTLGLEVGQKFTTAGFVSALNNRTFEITKIEAAYLYVKKRWTGVFEYSEAATFTPIPLVDKRCTSITHYLGTEVQTADPLLTAEEQARHGANAVPAFKGTAYTVIEGFQLRDFGNRLPQLNGIIEESIELPVGQALQKIIERADVPVPYDVGEVRGTIRGFISSEPSSVVSQLEPLLLAFNLAVVEDNGTLVFYTKGREIPVQVDATYLAAIESGQDPDSAARLFEINDSPSFDIPMTVNVQFFDPATNYQGGGQTESRINATSQSVSSINLPITMESRRARDVARRLLYTAANEASAVSFTLPGTYSYLQEGDMIEFTAYGEEWSIRLQEIERGANHILQIRGVLSETNTSRSRAVADDGLQDPIGTPYTPPSLLMVLKDLPALRDSDTILAGFYFGLSAEDILREWRGGTLFSSFDAVEYDAVSEATSECVMGICSTTLGTGPVGIFDTVSSLTVTMSNGTLESRSELEVLNGANRALIGSEIIGYRTATYLGSNQYTLTNLLRGLRDTTEFIGTHAAAEVFVQLDDNAGMLFYEMSTGDLGSAKSYKPVATGGSPDDVDVLDAVSFTPMGGTLKQFRPTNVAYTGTAATTVVFTWVRRSRALTRLFGTYFPVLHDEEKYKLVFTDGSVVKATYYVSALQTYSYTQAQRITDFGSSPSYMQLKISQLGPLGYGKEEIVDVNI